VIVRVQRYELPTWWLILALSTLAGLMLWIGQPESARGQGLDFETGVRHAIVASIDASDNVAAVKQDVKPRSATVDITVRVLSYAADYRFFGEVDGKFSDFDPDNGAEAQEIWTEQKCHQNRGLPKIWVLAVNGKITRGDSVFDIAARPRHLGQLVPQDEVVTQRDRNVEFSDPNKDLVMLARTTASRLSVRLNLKSTKCRLKD
jgi:hypothetical protein